MTAPNLDEIAAAHRAQNQAAGAGGGWGTVYPPGAAAPGGLGTPPPPSFPPRPPHSRATILSWVAALVAVAAGLFWLGTRPAPIDADRATSSTPTPVTSPAPTTATTATTPTTTATTAAPTTTSTAAPPGTAAARPAAASKPQSWYLETARAATSSGNTWQSEPNTINGTAFNHVAAVGWCQSCLDNYTKVTYVEWDLQRAYKTFKATAGQTDGSRDTSGVFLFEVIGDGTTLFSRQIPFGTSIPIEIDITGVLRFRLSVTLVSRKVNAGTGFGGALVEK